MDWQAVARERQQHLASTIAAIHPAVPEVSRGLPLNVTNVPQQLLPSDVVDITSKTCEVLLQELARGQISSSTVTAAFLQRAGLASRLANCVTELLPKRALQRAKFLDEYLAAHRRPLGPLHGLPISVKEHVSMKGLDLNAGFISWVGNVAEQDALILKLLWKAGCVFYVRTTEPQSLMHLETSSNIYGITVNPFNTNLTAGGSSGGEGALIGIGGSVLGIGTDIGGSIRSPAANNGAYGLRPTTYRLPLGGMAATMLGEEQIIPVVGPLSSSLEGIKIFMKALIDQKPWLYEPSLVPFAWRDSNERSLLRQVNGRQKLRVGVLSDDGLVKPHPPILRGIKHVLHKLQSNSDIEVIDFPPYRHDEAWRIISSLYFVDGAAEEKAAIDASGEPWRPMTNWIIKDNPNVKSRTVAEVWRLTMEREAYKTAYTRHWNSIGTTQPGPLAGADIEVAADTDEMVDVILCPVGPGCAPPLNCARYWGYTAQWNLLDYPSLAFPTGLTCSPEDEIEASYQPRNDQDEYNYKLYNPAVYVGAPISLQLVGRRYDDEKVIEALEFMLGDSPGSDLIK